jgi:ATP-dependent RNA helicase CshB
MLFNELKLKPFILKTLSDLKFKELTKIQEETIPTILHHKSLIITSQTGSGKTLCYLIPTLNDIEPSLRKTQTIILLPTKELARQVYSKYLEFINNEPSIRITLLIGNNDIEKQKVSIQHKAPHIIIGTTIRILELLEQKIINRDIKTIIIDEADMLTDSGFIPHINKIFGLINSESLQKIACSATTHESFANQLSKYLQNTRVVSTSKSI